MKFLLWLLGRESHIYVRWQDRDGAFWVIELAAMETVNL